MAKKKLSNRTQGLIAIAGAAAIGVLLLTRKKNNVAGIGAPGKRKPVILHEKTNGYLIELREENKAWGKTYQTVVKRHGKIIDVSMYLEDFNEAIRIYADFCTYYEELNK